MKIEIMRADLALNQENLTELGDGVYKTENGEIIVLDGFTQAAIINTTPNLNAK
jgi:hypothetical protein